MEGRRRHGEAVVLIQVARSGVTVAEALLESAGGVLGDVLGEGAGCRSGGEDAADGLMIEGAEGMGVTEGALEVGGGVALAEEQDLASLIAGKTRRGDGEAGEEGGGARSHVIEGEAELVEVGGGLLPGLVGAGRGDVEAGAARRELVRAAGRWTSLDGLNAQLADWIERVAHARPLPGTARTDGGRVLDALEDERPRLLPLPQHPFECDRVQAVVSCKTPYVRLDGNDYTIPDTLGRRPLTLVASESTVRVPDGTNEVARHVRSYDRRQHVEDPEHLAALARKKRRARELRTRDHRRTVCPHAGAFLEGESYRKREAAQAIAASRRSTAGAPATPAPHPARPAGPDFGAFSGPPTMSPPRQPLV